MKNRKRETERQKRRFKRSYEKFHLFQPEIIKRQNYRGSIFEPVRQREIKLAKKTERQGKTE